MIEQIVRHYFVDGEYYDKSNPLTAESVKERKTPGI